MTLCNKNTNNTTECPQPDWWRLFYLICLNSIVITTLVLGFATHFYFKIYQRRMTMEGYYIWTDSNLWSYVYRNSWVSSASVKTNMKMCFPRHFLFKPGGTSPMYCTTSPGYPLTSSTVYSPPPRPLPRNTFSRPAFNLKKPYKHCNWKCAALSAILISVTLLLLLAYFIGEWLQALLHSRMCNFTHTPPTPHRWVPTLFCFLHHPI